MCLFARWHVNVDMSTFFTVKKAHLNGQKGTVDGQKGTVDGQKGTFNLEFASIINGLQSLKIYKNI